MVVEDLKGALEFAVGECLRWLFMWVYTLYTAGRDDDKLLSRRENGASTSLQFCQLQLQPTFLIGKTGVDDLSRSWYPCSEYYCVPKQ